MILIMKHFTSLTFNTAKVTVLGLAAAFLIVSCTWEGINGNAKSVENTLRGTWERTEADFWPVGQNTVSAKGCLKITYDTVTINGPIAQLQGFTRDTALEAYTEEGYLYIKDKGAWQSPVAYTRWQAAGSFPRDELFTFPSSGETLKRIAN
jgi:hypothetical protein